MCCHEGGPSGLSSTPPSSPVFWLVLAATTHAFAWPVLRPPSSSLEPEHSIPAASHALQRGGSILHTEWKPDGSGELYTFMIQQVTAAMKASPESRLRGMIWVQVWRILGLRYG